VGSELQVHLPRESPGGAVSSQGDQKANPQVSGHRAAVYTFKLMADPVKTGGHHWRPTHRRSGIQRRMGIHSENQPSKKLGRGRQTRQRGRMNPRPKVGTGICQWPLRGQSQPERRGQVSLEKGRSQPRMRKKTCSDPKRNQSQRQQPREVLGDQERNQDQERILNPPVQQKARKQKLSAADGHHACRGEHWQKAERSSRGMATAAE
jgi:hypothetical protein